LVTGDSTTVGSSGRLLGVTHPPEGPGELLGVIGPTLTDGDAGEPSSVASSTPLQCREYIKPN